MDGLDARVPESGSLIEGGMTGLAMGYFEGSWPFERAACRYRPGLWKPHAGSDAGSHGLVPGGWRLGKRVDGRWCEVLMPPSVWYGRYAHCSKGKLTLSWLRCCLAQAATSSKNDWARTSDRR